MDAPPVEEPAGTGMRRRLRDLRGLWRERVCPLPRTSDDFPTSVRNLNLALQDLIQKQLRAVFGGVGEDVVGGAEFY